MIDASTDLKINRYKGLLQRTIKDVKIFFASVIFAFRYSGTNKFIDLFSFRKAIEIKQISPFRIFLRAKKNHELVPLSLPQFGNVKIAFDLNDKFQMAICEEFVKYNIYDLKLINFIPDISIDCGSYRGYFTFLINHRFKNCKKICIEPHPENYLFLIKTIEENKITNIESFNKALSKSSRKVVLELWGSNMSLPNSQCQNINLVYVETISLFALLSVIDSRKRLVLKVDIEGNELDFFPECIGMLPPSCAVYIETHDGWRSLHNIQKRFEEFEFKFSVLRERGICIDSFAMRS